VTGEVNSGKTARLLSIYRKLGCGDGFINAKIYRGGRFVGQRIIRLSTGESAIFSTISEFIPPDWDEVYKFGNFSFSGKGQAFARNVVYSVIERGIEPVFVDEIGPLELQKKGFYDIMSVLLGTKSEIYAVIRKSCVDSVLKEFDIKAYDIIFPEY
jgi:nucleoside-triphosphatase THEP1